MPTITSTDDTDSLPFITALTMRLRESSIINSKLREEIATLRTALRDQEKMALDNAILNEEIARLKLELETQLSSEKKSKAAAEAKREQDLKLLADSISAEKDALKKEVATLKLEIKALRSISSINAAEIDHLRTLVLPSIPEVFGKEVERSEREAELIEQIERLKAENAELRTRLNPASRASIILPPLAYSSRTFKASPTPTVADVLVTGGIRLPKINFEFKK